MLSLVKVNVYVRFIRKLLASYEDWARVRELSGAILSPLRPKSPFSKGELGSDADMAGPGRYAHRRYILEDSW
jgi:hypothetical protein